MQNIFFSSWCLPKASCAVIKVLLKRWNKAKLLSAVKFQEIITQPQCSLLSLNSFYKQMLGRILVINQMNCEMTIKKLSWKAFFLFKQGNISRKIFLIHIIILHPYWCFQRSVSKRLKSINKCGFHFIFNYVIVCLITSGHYFDEMQVWRLLAKQSTPSCVECFCLPRRIAHA